MSPCHSDMVYIPLHRFYTSGNLGTFTFQPKICSITDLAGLWEWSLSSHTLHWYLTSILPWPREAAVKVGHGGYQLCVYWVYTALDDR